MYIKLRKVFVHTSLNHPVNKIETALTMIYQQHNANCAAIYTLDKLEIKFQSMVRASHVLK